MNNIKFFPMDHPDFWSRPQYLKTGYTFRNGEYFHYNKKCDWLTEYYKN